MNREFHYPSQFRLGGRIITGIALVLLLAFAVLMLEDREATSNQPWLFASIAVLALILISFGTWMTHAHSGTVILGEHEVTVQRGRRLQSIPLAQISGIAHTHRAFKTLILQGEGIRLSINKNLIDYQAFYETLRQRTAVRHENEYSTTLLVKSNTGETWFGAGAFMLLGAGLCGMLWYGTLAGEVSIWILIATNAVLDPLIVGGFIWILGCPTSYLFDAEQIIERRPRGDRTYLPHRIASARYGQMWRRIPRYGSRLVHFIEFTFEDGKKVTIDDTATHYPIEDIAAFAKRLYRLEGKLKEVSAGKKEA
jgi:hypothetical protein